MLYGQNSYSRGSFFTSAWWMLMAQGVGLILFGLVILAMPELLIYLVAFGFIMVGVALTTLAWRAKALRRGF